MYLQQHIRIVYLFLALISSSVIFGQSDTLSTVPSTYKNEYNPWFKLTIFKRGFLTDSLKIALDDLEKIPRQQWVREDSLNFARLSLNTGNTDLAEYYFDALKVVYNTEKKFWWDYLMIHYIQEDYKKGLALIYKDNPGILMLSEIYVMEQIFLAKIKEKEDNKWFRLHFVLNWTPDTTLKSVNKNSEEFRSEILQPLENINHVLHLLIHYVHDSDQIIARVCYEMGIVLEDYVSWTQAYIVYSLGRNYNKRDKNILARVKSVKTKLLDSKYKIPIFRRYFPRTEYWRFDYELLKERHLIQKVDTTVRYDPVLMRPIEKKPLPFKPNWIIFVGILITFVLILFLVKTRK